MVMLRKIVYSNEATLTKPLVQFLWFHSVLITVLVSFPCCVLQLSHPPLTATMRPWAPCAMLPTPGILSTSLGLMRSVAVQSLTTRFDVWSKCFKWVNVCFDFREGCQRSTDQGTEGGDWQAEEHAAQLWNGMVTFFSLERSTDSHRDTPHWVYPLSTVRLWIKEISTLQVFYSKGLTQCFVSFWHF